MLLGLLGSLLMTLLVVQRSVVDVLFSLRRSILDVAEGRLDQPIGYRKQTNEVGEMARALATLQDAARSECE